MGDLRIVEVVGNTTGGGTAFVAALLQRLAREPARVTLVAPEARWLAELCRSVGTHYRSLPLMSGRMNRDVRRRLGSILREAEPHVVHAHGTRAAWYVSRCLPLMPRAPRFIYSEHLFAHDARRGIAKLPWFGLEWFLCHRADVLTTGCESNAHRAVRSFQVRPRRIGLRHYGVDLEAIRSQRRRALSRAELGVPEHAPLIGTVGRLIPQKGFGDLIDAMALIGTQYPDTTCLVVGDGELRKQLETRCRNLGMEGRVRFLGARTEPWTILAACDLIALSSWHEGLWFALIEALAAGIPVVATRTGGALDLLFSGRNGLLVPCGNPRALAAAIDQMLADQALQMTCREAGPSAVAAYDLEPVLGSMMCIYRAQEEIARRVE
jgi:glycosyltransferase involved in cell wall biosynthesis